MTRSLRTVLGPTEMSPGRETHFMSNWRATEAALGAQQVLADGGPIWRQRDQR